MDTLLLWFLVLVFHKCGANEKGNLSCASDPCQNNGFCSDSGNAPVCTCFGPYYGEYCEIDCSDNLCENGGTCSFQNGNKTCDCPTEYNGAFCEFKLCDPNPCKNGGSCTIMNAEAHCICSSEFQGKHCEVGVTETSSTFHSTDFVDTSISPKHLKTHGICSSNPCKNGGTCIPGNNEDFKCICEPRRKGKTCEENACNPNPCKNNGTCELSENSYKCNCQNENQIGDCGQELDPCSSEPCPEGNCESNGSNFICICDEGQVCDERTSGITSPKPPSSPNGTPTPEIPTPGPSPSPSGSSTPEPSPSPSGSPTPEILSPEPSPSPSGSSTPEPSPSPSGSSTPEPSPSPSGSPTPDLFGDEKYPDKIAIYSGGAAGILLVSIILIGGIAFFVSRRRRQRRRLNYLQNLDSSSLESADSATYLA